MTTRAKTATALIGAATIALLLTACDPGGAQNIDPVGKVPGSEDTKTPTCDVASKAAVDLIDEAVGSHDDTDVAMVQQGDGGWYLGASIAPNTKDDPNDDEVTVWATTKNPVDQDFDGPIYAVNTMAKDAVADESSGPSVAPSPFDAGSSAAKRVVSCTIEAVDH